MKRAPHARVAILGYPWILPPDRGCFDKMPVAKGDVPYLRGVQATLNDAVRRAAAATGATYVGFAQVSEGHDACQATGVRWIEPVLQGTNPVVVHPNALGRAAHGEADDDGCSTSRWRLDRASAALAGLPVDQLAGDVEVAAVRAYSWIRWSRIHCSCGAGRLVGEPPTHRRGLGQLVRLDDRPRASARRLEQRPQLGRRRVRRDPAVVVGRVAPRVGHRLGQEAPPQPAPLDVDQVVDQPGRRPARTAPPTPSARSSAQPLDLVGDDAAEEVEVVEHQPAQVRVGARVSGNAVAILAIRTASATAQPSTRRARSTWKRVDSSRSSTWIRSLALW